MRHDPTTRRRHLADLCWTELHGRTPLLLVPVGSCEQHGPHLPMRTDTVIAEAVAERSAAMLTEMGLDVLITPPIEITASGEHQGFAGTLSIGTTATTELLVELVRSADWSGGLVLVNGHGGNREAVTTAATTATHERRQVLTWWPPIVVGAEPGDLHAGHIETSLMLAIAPDQVRVDPVDVAPVAPVDTAALRARGVRAVSRTGVLGDPRSASASIGADVLGTWADDLTSSVHRWVDTRTRDAPSSEVGVPDTNVPDTNVPDTNVPDTNVPNTNVPNTNMKESER